jgi:hypothetical protein
MCVKEQMKSAYWFHYFCCFSAYVEVTTNKQRTQFLRKSKWQTGVKFFLVIMILV